MTAKKPKSKVKSVAGTLLTVTLLITTQPFLAYAAGDNPAYSTIDVFPTSSDSSNTMDVNAGTINELSRDGHDKREHGKY